MKKILITIIVVMILAILGGLYYWYFHIQNPTKPITKTTAPAETPAFSPFGSTEIPTPTATSTASVKEDTATEDTDTSYKQPKLRQISTTPVAGFVASTSAVRYIERGTGHVYEALLTSEKVNKISNTTLPKIYEAYGNKSGTNFIVQYLKDESDIITNFYAELRATGTSTTETPFQLKGRYLSPDINQIAISPSGDRIFTWNIENGRGAGYISAFDEKNKIKIADVPFTQATIDWPETSTVTISTKASAVASGFIYTQSTKGGIMKNVLSGIKGLTGKINRDLTKIIYSGSAGGSFITFIKNIKDGTVQELVFKTLSDKCVWSNLRKNEVYCAAPTEIPQGLYPDDWYKGSISFVDQIWYLNTTTGEVHLMASPLELSDTLIDATNLILDPEEYTLYFINKRDLTLWALDLNQ